MERIKLFKTLYIPKDLESGILYVSEEFGVACHLCPCGCGSKVVTPIGPTEWSFSEVDDKPTLYPSIGNWQFPCKSHYWIEGGLIKWSYQWTDEQIMNGRQMEEIRRRAYYENMHHNTRRQSILQKIYNWFKKLTN